MTRQVFLVSEQPAGDYERNQVDEEAGECRYHHRLPKEEEQDAYRGQCNESSSKEHDLHHSSPVELARRATASYAVGDRFSSGIVFCRSS